MNLYKLGYTISRIYFKLFFKLEVIGHENIPKTGGVLLCTNHISNLDPPLVGSAMEREVHFMAKGELFEKPILKSLLPKINAFPVRRGMSDKQALKSGLSLLREGKVLGLFPEGTRSKDKKLGKGLAGAGFFALRTDAQVIPAAIMGEYKRFKPLTVVYGEPIDMAPLRENKISAQEATDKIMESIQKLLDKHK